MTFRIIIKKTLENFITLLIRYILWLNWHASSTIYMIAGNVTSNVGSLTPDLKTA